MNLEDIGDESGDLENEFELLGDLGHFELSAEVLDGDKACQNLADSEAVDELDFLEIEKDISLADVQLGLHELVERRLPDIGAADFSFDIEDDRVIHFTNINDHNLPLSPMCLSKASRKVNIERCPWFARKGFDRIGPTQDH